ncbi:MAG TPA: hypothetical protein PLP01_15105, partial [Phycisphaerae bacterium]|nr:hypothetical protein [Phycisphaerae bacterium]
MSHRDTTVLFEEVQRLRAPWPRVLVSPGLWGGLIGLVWIVFHWIQHGALPWFAWVALPCGVLLVVLSLWMNWKLVLATRVEAGCVTVAMNRTTTFTWASCEIERCSQVAVKPWRDFSEWG